MKEKCRVGNLVRTLALMLTFSMLVLSTAVCPAQGSSTSENSRSAGVLDGSARSEIIDSVLTALTTYYVFPGKARQLAGAIRQNVEAGQYDRMTDLGQFVSELSSNLREMSKDRHLKITVIPPGGLDQFASDTVTAEQIAEMARRNFGFKDAKILPGNVGYLDVRVFEDPSYAGATATAAMDFLANTDAMIIDVRGNGGGHGGMVTLLSSYFFAEPEPLNSFYSFATDSITQRRTLGFLSGKRRPTVDLYVLADRYSASAAEDFLYGLQSLERATIVGETTVGAANTVDFYPFENLGVLA
ncbi:MAG: S41 family peptidase, partial [Candidatus Zixiibacteriota bacterium]